MRGWLIAPLLALCAGCAGQPLRPQTERLAVWTEALRNSQPDDAFLLMYKVHGHYLAFVGAQHAEDVHSKTFAIINQTYAHFRFDTLIAEGWPNSFGPNDARVMGQASQAPAADGFQEGGETVPALRGAVDHGATVWGGEPDDLAVKELVAAQAISPRDLLGFYALRYIPQAIREREVSDADDPRAQQVVERRLAHDRPRLQISPDILPDFAAWRAWYAEANGKPFGKSFDAEEAGPLAASPLRSNRIAAAVAKARDAFLHRLIVQHLDAHESVVVVYGGSHAMIHRPALDAVLGPACYFGDNIALARKRCG